MKIGHAHLKVRDLETSVDFYTRFLGLRVTEIISGQYAFLTDGVLHHDLALQAVGADAPMPHAHGVGLYPVAFEVPDKAAFAQAYQELVAAGVAVHPVDHTSISWALYFDDPDGNGLEIYLDTRSESEAGTLWLGVNRPLPPSRILAA